MSDHRLDRRTLIRSAGAVGVGSVGAGALSGCGSGSGASTGSADSSSVASSDTSSGAATGAASGASVPVADVPVGGGKIVGKVVVTQPTAGTFKAFSAICTHKGCTVSKVEGGKIACPCHGSMYDVSTGAPTAGPAQKPLAAKTATVEGTNVVVS